MSNSGLIQFSTNLDLAKGYVSRLHSKWRYDGSGMPPLVPQKGTRIRFNIPGSERKTFELQVVMVTYDEEGAAYVELHIPDWQSDMSIRGWEEWFRSHVRGAVY